MIGIEIQHKILARTNDDELLEKNPHRRIDRWSYGVYLPQKDPDAWAIPVEFKQSEIYIEVIYPVDKNFIVYILDCSGNVVNPFPCRKDVPGLATENVVCRGSLMIFALNVINGSVSIRKINAIHSNGEIILMRRRIFHSKSRISVYGNFMPKSFGLPRESFLNMFWGVLNEACDEANIKKLLNPAQLVRRAAISPDKNGKVIVKIGVAAVE